jgi:hypothetical protein
MPWAPSLIGGAARKFAAAYNDAPPSVDISSSPHLGLRIGS